MSLVNSIANWNRKFRDATAKEIIEFSGSEFGKGLSFACSFGFEDMLILDFIAESKISCEVFYLDTGRLNDETYSLIAKAEKHYRSSFTPYFPEATDVESFIKASGINGFYDNIQSRKDCCHVRKVKPLQRALAQKTAWITGLRREQSIVRADLETFELDGNGLVKVSPLKFWTWDQLKEAQEQRQFPISDLHKRGFTSIGCAPCTRPVSPKADFRDGRWWWETDTSKECGLHSNQRN